jgi:hypothetical protein
VAKDLDFLSEIVWRLNNFLGTPIKVQIGSMNEFTKDGF